MKRVIICAILASAAAPFARANPVNLIVNGSFEEPLLREGSNTYGVGSTDITGWTVVGPSGGVKLVHNSVFRRALDGVQQVDLAGGNPDDVPTGIEQVVNVVAGGDYWISLNEGALALLPGETSPGVYQIKMLINGTYLTTVGVGPGISPSGSPEVWGGVGLRFTAPTDQITITLLNDNRSNSSGFSGVDNVSLVAMSATDGVPEPAAWAMMILGFGLAGAAIRRRPSRPGRIEA